MRPTRRTRHRTLAALAVAGLGLAGLQLPAGAGPLGTLLPSAQDAATSGDVVQLVRVATPTREAKDRLVGLGLDLTEHAGEDFVEAVLHGTADADVLRAAGLTWTVEVPDLARRQAQVNRENKAFAEATTVTDLPSGRDSYRVLADYESELASLAEQRPDLVQRFALPHKTLEGRTVYGVEIAADVAKDDGRPVMLMMGLHHAREWPSGEHAMEFAHDLVNAYGKDARISDLLRRARVVVVPVANPDGFHQSVTDGMLVDLREVDDGGTVSILGTPGNAYKRKNCRVEGLDATPPGACEAASPGGYGVGVDLNRNYGGFWGGPGAATLVADATYRGAGPFSEPETQNVRELVSSHHVTTLITNHTFSNLVLRPPGLREAGDTPDEPAYADLGARMAAQNGYTNQKSWQLYDTTGTTEDWSYYATGGLGFTFEIGDEFHPPFPEVVDQYLGSGEYAGKGNREAYLVALENTVDPTMHSRIAGKAPAGAVLRLAKEFATPTYDGSAFTDRLETTMVVPASGSYTWHVNPSTRPLVAEQRREVLDSEPVREQQYSGDPAGSLPTQSTDHVFTVTETGVAAMQVKLSATLPSDDYDLEVYRSEGGVLTKVGSSGNLPGAAEEVVVEDPQPGEYVLRVVNYAAAGAWQMTAGLYGSGTEVTGGLVEAWTLTCERADGTVLQRVPVVVERGQQVKPDLGACRSAFRR